MTRPIVRRRIYLCGPIAEPGEPARGGFQACNRRTIDALAARGVDVRPLPYPQPRRGGFGKLLQYALGFVRLAWQTASCRRGSVFHLTGLHRRFIQAEIALIYLARLRRCFCIYDLRAGSAPHHYQHRGRFFRASFRLALSSVDLVLVEGERLTGFVESLTGRSPVLFPNHIDTESIPKRERGEQAQGGPVLTYAGSLKPEKGIRTILEAARLLNRAGLSVDVRLAGTGPEDFVDELRGAYRDLDVSWMGPLPSDDVLDLFRTAHFFVFPTDHVGEGQSNALTEAMACGCVPIASDHGFNAAVIGQAGAVLPPRSQPSDYARVIREVWMSGRWPDYSRQAEQEIRERFDTRPVIEALMAQYGSSDR